MRQNDGEDELDSLIELTTLSRDVGLGTTYTAEWCLFLVWAINGLRNVYLSKRLLAKSGLDQNERT